MKGPLSTLVACLVLVLAAVGYGMFERHVGAHQAAARAHADSLLHADSVNQALVARQDSIRSKVAQDSLQVLGARLRAAQQRREASQAKADSLAGVIATDSVVPRDTVIALVAAFRGERAAADAQIATLTTENTLLRGELSQKDSTIARLNSLLTGERTALAKALRPSSPSLFAKAFDVAKDVLAVRGLVAFAVSK